MNVRVVLVVAAVIPAVLAAGCGGSSAPSVASLGTTTVDAGTTSSAKPSRAAFAACLGSHGFDASPDSAATAPKDSLSIVGVQIGGNVDPSSPQFQAALQACRKFLPGGGPPALTPAQQAEHGKAMAHFAACMRKHGVPSFPDPDAQGTFSPGALKRLGLGTPLFERAFTLCSPLQGTIGPRIDIGP